MKARIRVICTLGPGAPGGRRLRDKDEYVAGLVRAGMDVARINLSHAGGAADLRAGRAPDYSRETRSIDLVQRESAAAGPESHVAVLLDLQGIKLRLYLPVEQRRTGLAFDTGAEFRMRLTAEPSDDELACDASPLVRQALRDALSRQDSVQVAIADGDPMLTCVAVDDDVAVLRASEPGKLRHRKGVTFRNVDLVEEPPLPFRDRVDLAAFALPALLRGDADLLALSFTRSAADIAALRAFCRVSAAFFREGVEPADAADAELLRKLDGLLPDLRAGYGPLDPDDIQIVAKLETRSATENLDGILLAADAVMIARGDLGLQCRPEDVPRLQKDIIHRAALLCRPSIVATQMLGSMEKAPEPTRAEASDVFNAVLDGADALMLSGETALGQRPHDAVAMLRQVALAAAGWRDGSRFGRGMLLNHMRMDVSKLREDRGENDQAERITDRMTVEAVRIAEGLGCEAIVAVTRSGRTARNIARFFSLVPVVAIVPDARTARSLALVGSVRPVVATGETEGETLAAGLAGAVDAGLLAQGMRVLVAGARADDPAGATSVLAVRLV